MAIVSNMAASFQFHIQQVSDTSPLTDADVDALAKVAGDAFLPDRHTQLKYPWQGRNWFYEHSLQSTKESFALASQKGGSRLDFLVAREGPEPPNGTPETGKPIGLCSWVRRGPRWGNNFLGEEQRVSAEVMAKGRPIPPVFAKENGSLKDLSDFNNRDMSYWITRYMAPGTNVMYVNGFQVAPQYQGKGVGKALMKWGTDKADAEGVICWAHSSESARPAYEACGFNVVEDGETTVRLDDFARGDDGVWKGPEEGGEWGNYSWCCLVRQPKPVAQ